MSHRLSWLSAALIALPLATGCSTDATSPPAVGSMVIVSGDGQVGTPGLPLPDTLVAQVLSNIGNPLPHTSVRWTVTYGGGSLTYASDTSDAAGKVRAILALGPVPGAALVVAAVGDLPGVTFTGTARGLQATVLTVGTDEVCAVDMRSRTWCWGDPSIRGDSGRWYTDRVHFSWIPTQVAGGHIFVELAAGLFHACGLDATGAVWCWGYNEQAALGNGTTVDEVASYPMKVPNAPAFAHIFSGDGSTTCALTADGTAWCWGANYYGQVGSGSNINPIADPQQVAGGLKFTSLSPTYDHTCGIAVGGAAYCWGNNAGGVLLGDSGASGPSSNIPVAVAGGHLFRTLYATDAFSCGTTSDAGPVCWGNWWAGAPGGIPRSAPFLAPLTEYRPTGWNGLAFGILGNQAIYIRSPTSFTDDFGDPTPLHGLSAGFWTACGLAQDATVYCWGDNEVGQVGNPDQNWFDDSWAPAHAVAVPSSY